MATRDFNFATGPETDILPTATTPSVDDDLMTKGFADNNYVQGGAGVADNAALKAIVASDRKDIDLRFVDSTQTLYNFDSGSAASDDGVNVLAPDTGSGRWLKIVTANTNIQNFIDTTQSTTKDTGAVIVEGGVGIEKNLNVGGNTTVEGDLTVKGTKTTINTTTLDVEDSNITVNKGGNQAAADSNDAGIRVEMSDATDAQVHFDSTTTSKFKAGEVGSEIEIATISAAQVITNKDIDGATAADTRRITMPKDITANLNGLTRKEGTLLFDSTTKEFQGDNGTVLSAFSTAAIATANATGTITSFVPVIKSGVKTVSSVDYPILDDDGFHTILVTTGALDRIITLPDVANNTGRILDIKKVDTGIGEVIIDGDGATIDGVATRNLAGENVGKKITCGVSNWSIIGNGASTIGNHIPITADYATGTFVTSIVSSQAGLFERHGNVVTWNGRLAIATTGGGIPGLGDFKFDMSTLPASIAPNANFSNQVNATGQSGGW